ncbi:TPA: ATP-binding protein [Candidatus Poribacteria bacterium]|nr:ATP-binding protein [Candidatus Poribacteria bacterium]
MDKPREYLIKLEFSSDMKLIYILDAVVSEILKEMNFPEEASEQVNLAVIEAGTNAIKHGNKNDPNKKVHFEFEISADKLTITVRDEGEGFNPDEVCDPLNPENLLRPSGRGIFLMRTFMDEVKYNETGTEVTMIKYREPK